MNEELLSVCLYCDQTGLFSEWECEQDNLCDMYFPPEVLKEWYLQNEDLISSVQAEVTKEIFQEMGDSAWKYWLDYVSTADDTDGLFQFAMDRGVIPRFGVLGKFFVYRVDGGGKKERIFNGTYDECRWFCRNRSWKMDGDDLQVDF